MSIKRSLILVFCLLTVQTLHAEAVDRVFVTNEKSNDMTVINSKTLEVETTVPVGNRPRGIHLSPDGKELYIAIGNENVIKVIDPRTLKIIRQLHAGSDPEDFAVHPNGEIYISNEDAAKASVFDPKTDRKLTEIDVGLEPEGVAISPDGKYVVVTSESSSLLHIIKVPENTIIKNIVVGARPRSAIFNREGTLIYASSEIGGEIQEIDTRDFKIINSVKLGNDKAKPKDLRLSKDEKTLYVAGGRANAVFVLDAVNMKVLKKIPVGKRVWGLAMNRDKTRLFTTNGVSGTVSVIDTASNEVIKTIKVGSFPWGVVVDD